MTLSPDFLNALGRHFLTFCAVMGVLWTAGRPLAQDFIEDTVDGRLGKLEQSIIGIQGQQTASDIAQNQMRLQLEQLLKEQTEAGRDNTEILRLLRGLQSN